MSNDINRQLRTRLAGLEQAGVSWLPRITALPPFAPSDVPASEATSESSSEHSLESRRRELAVLTDQVRPAGSFEVAMAADAGGKRLRAGIYFVRAERPGDGEAIVRRVAVVR